MAIAIGLAIYVLFAAVVGMEGRSTRGGFIGTFVLSLLVTPLISYILLCCFEEVPEEERTRRKPRVKDAV